jgi:hypothetical protein
VRFIWNCRLRRGRILSESARSVMVHSGGGYFVLTRGKIVPVTHA